MNTNNGFIVAPNSDIIYLQLIHGCGYGISGPNEKHVDPPTGTTRGIPTELYHQTRRGLVSACADVVIFIQVVDGFWGVLLSKRKPTKCFGGTWWIHGGAIYSYQDIFSFTKDRATDECNCHATIRALVSVAYTSASDHPGSTLQPCYLGTIAHENTSSIATDKDHTDARLFSREEYRRLPSTEKHWYPTGVIEACFDALERN